MRTPDIDTSGETVYVVQYPSGEAGQGFGRPPLVRATALAVRVDLPGIYGGPAKSNGVRMRLEERLRTHNGTELPVGHEFVVRSRDLEGPADAIADDRMASREARYSEQDAIVAGMEALGGPEPRLRGGDVIFTRTALAAWLTGQVAL